MAQRERDKKEGDPWYVKADHVITSWSICYGNIIVAIETARKTNLPNKISNSFQTHVLNFSKQCTL